MKPELELEVERQSVHAGEEVRGRVTLRGVSSYRDLTVTLQGEEVLDAGNLVRSYVYPVMAESRRLAGDGETPAEGEFAFAFPLPREIHPSYASSRIRCRYLLKARLKAGGLMPREVIQRLHLTVLPPFLEEQPATPHDLVIEEGGLRLEAHLERTTLASGESLRGSLLLDRETDEVPLPTRLTFRLAAIEESTEPGFRHRQALWVQSHEVEPTPRTEFPLWGTFEFPVDRDAPFTGEWNTFRLHYGFRVGMNLPGGRQVRRSLPIRVYRRYIPAREGLGIA